MENTVQLAPELVAAKRALREIPIIDSFRLPCRRRGRPRRHGAKIGTACREIGFFYVVNHGVPEALVAEIYAQAKRFFALPADQKAEIAIEKSACHRGWFQVGGENLDPEKQKKTGDFKEGMKIGRDLGPGPSARARGHAAARARTYGPTCPAGAR